MSNERVNWPVAAGATIAGGGALAVGFGLSDDRTGTWSSVFIQVGIAIGLVSVLVFLERRLFRRVAEATARAETERITAGLRGRIKRLEGVDAAQHAARAEQRRASQERMEAIREGDITHATIGDLLVEAISDRLVDPGLFHVRTSDDPACPLLYMTPYLEGSPGQVKILYLDFEPLIDSGETMVIDGQSIPVPEQTASTVVWIAGNDAGAIGAELEAGRERRNEPAHGFGLRHAVEMLLRSIEVMQAARMAPAGSPQRLEGELRVLINDEWAYTSAGLEAVAHETIFPVRPAGFDERSRWVGAYMSVETKLRTEADSSLAEAFTWMQERERVQVLEPGTDPVQALFKNRPQQ